MSVVHTTKSKYPKLKQNYINATKIKLLSSNSKLLMMFIYLRTTSVHQVPYICIIDTCDHPECQLLMKVKRFQISEFTQLFHQYLCQGNDVTPSIMNWILSKSNGSSCQSGSEHRRSNGAPHRSKYNNIKCTDVRTIQIRTWLNTTLLFSIRKAIIHFKFFHNLVTTSNSIIQN